MTTRRLGFINLTCAAGNTCNDQAMCPVGTPNPPITCGGTTGFFECTELTAQDVDCALMKKLPGIADELVLTLRL